MGEIVEFPSNGHRCCGYLSLPTGKGAAVVVIQEWWGLVEHIENVTDRFARAGFVAIAPDLYHGEKTSSPDTAKKLLMEMDVEQAGKEISAAAKSLLSRPECSSAKYGVVGFCMGGALAQYVATKDRNVGAAVSFYGGFRKVRPDWASLDAPLLLIYGENDPGVPAADGRKLAAELKAAHKHVEVVVYPGAGHAFFNDARPEVYEPRASEDAWKRTLKLFTTALR